MADPRNDDWDELPILLKVEEAMRVLRIGRSKVYEMTALYLSSGGTAGLPVLRLGDVLRVPRFALYELVTTGQIVQLTPPVAVETCTTRTTTGRRTPQKRTATDRSQLSLLAAD